jgi:hypothetical protein
MVLIALITVLILYVMLLLKLMTIILNLCWGGASPNIFILLQLITINNLNYML